MIRSWLKHAAPKRHFHWGLLDRTTRYRSKLVKCNTEPR